MSVSIILKENGNTEERLIIEDNLTVTYHCENAGWVMARKGSQAEYYRYTIEEAKNKWPEKVQAIDRAAQQIKDENS